MKLLPDRLVKVVSQARECSHVHVRGEQHQNILHLQHQRQHHHILACRFSSAFRRGELGAMIKALLPEHTLH